MTSHDPSLIGTICKLTGLSKRVLAAFIAADHSLLTRYEAGTRSLPAPALEQLVQVFKILQAMPAAPVAQISKDEISEMQQEAVWCLAKCHPIQKKLEAMLLAYHQGCAVLQLVEAYKPAAAGLLPKKQRWLEEQKYQAEKKIAANSSLARHKLSIRIAALQFEASLYQNTGF